MKQLTCTSVLRGCCGRVVERIMAPRSADFELPNDAQCTVLVPLQLLLTSPLGPAALPCACTSREAHTDPNLSVAAAIPAQPIVLLLRRKIHQWHDDTIHRTNAASGRNSLTDSEPKTELTVRRRDPANWRVVSSPEKRSRRLSCHSENDVSRQDSGTGRQLAFGFKQQQRE